MSDSFREFVLDQLRGLGGIRCKPMFGGYGLYRDGRFFGIIFKERAYFKVSESAKGSYVKEGMKPFAPARGKTLTSFYEIPADVLESPPRMLDWARDAVRSATRKVFAVRADVSPGRILAGHTPGIRSLAENLRNLVKEAVPDALERAYPGWRAISYRHPRAGYFCAIFPMEGLVKLGFEHGARLPDPHGLLKAGVSRGRRVRYVEVRSRKGIRGTALAGLLKSAVNFAAQKRREA